MFMLNIENMSTEEVFGHYLESTGRIPHDKQREAGINNSLCRGLMREAEAFAEGYRLGVKAGEKE